MIWKEKCFANFFLILKYLKNYFKYINHVKLTKMEKSRILKKTTLIWPMHGHMNLTKTLRAKFYSKLKLQDTAGASFCILLLKKFSNCNSQISEIWGQLRMSSFFITYEYILQILVMFNPQRINKSWRVNVWNLIQFQYFPPGTTFFIHIRRLIYYKSW